MHAPHFVARGEVALYIKQQKPINPWRAVAIFPSQEFDPGVHPHYEEFFASGRLRRIYLAELPQLLLQKFPLNLFRIILDSKQSVLTTAQVLVRELSHQTTNENERGEFLDLLINLLMSKLPQVARKEIEKMIEPLLSDVRQSRAFQEVAEEIRQELLMELQPKLRQELTPKLTQELTPKLTQELTPKLTQELTPRIAQQEKRGIALNMLKKNFDVEIIAEITGLSFEQILALDKR